MTIKTLHVMGLTAAICLFAACASNPGAPESEAPPPPQNLLGSTDELQLISELALELAGKYGPGRVLVVLDIDNTLLSMDADRGLELWREVQNGSSDVAHCAAALAISPAEAQSALYFAGTMRPTQPDAARQVARMQEAGLRVIALSARGPGFRQATFRELGRNGFSFGASAWPPARGFAEPFVPQGGARHAVYEDGVIFAAGQDKGRTLGTMLKLSGQANPALIIMVDDSQANLNDAMAVFTWSGTGLQAWRYTRSDAAADVFDPDRSEALWAERRPPLEHVRLFGPDGDALRNCMN